MCIPYIVVLLCEHKELFSLQLSWLFSVLAVVVIVVVLAVVVVVLAVVGVVLFVVKTLYVNSANVCCPAYGGQGVARTLKSSSQQHVYVIRHRS